MQVSKNTLLIEYQIRLAVVLMLFFLSSVSMFGQTKSEVIALDSNTILANTATLIAASDSDIDFMNWFMGSKQAQASSSNEISTTTNTKKQLINSGCSTNRVLYKTLVKKLVSTDNAIV